MALKFKTRGSADDALNQLIQLASFYEKRRAYKRDEELSEYKSELANLDTLLSSSNDLDSLNTTISLINKGESKYDKHQTSDFHHEVVKQKAKNKLSNYNNYKDVMNVAKKRYFGGDGMKGIVDLKEEDMKTWTYDYISSELNKLDDFNMALYDDIQQQQQVSFIGHYNPGGITDKQLIDRMGDYREQLNAGLSADRDNKKIDDHELSFVWAGDKEGLLAARAWNVETGTKIITKIDTAQGSIKKSIKQLESFISKEGVNFDPTKMIYSGANASKLQADFNLDNEGYDNFDDYYTEKSAEQLAMTPQQLIKSWIDEIQALEVDRLNEISRIKKWGGQDWTAGKDEWSQLMEEKLRSTIYDEKITLYEHKSEESPLDLEYDIENNAYFSPSEQKYYSVESVEKSLGI